MIRNILFDMGGVLVRWDPARFIADLHLPEEDGQLLLREIYRSWRWVELDRGVLREDELLTYVKPRIPERLHAAAVRLVLFWDEPPASPPGMVELAEDLAEAGYNLYLFTNASQRHYSYWPRYRVAPLFGDRIFRSSDWKLLKPDPAFFEKGLEHFGLRARDCVFIDDSPPNVAAAHRVGIAPVVFHGDAALLRRDLRALGVQT